MRPQTVIERGRPLVPRLLCNIVVICPAANSSRPTSVGGVTHPTESAVQYM